jgi:Di-haem oxidoreductase, putative peroxidase
MFARRTPLSRCFSVVVALISCVSITSAQSGCVLKDPGPRPAGNTIFYSVADGHGNNIPNFTQASQGGGHNSSGNFLPNLTLNEFNFWEAGMAKFGDIASVPGLPVGVNGPEPLNGLGPRFNGNSCFMCHSQPAIGGSSPGQGTPLFAGNPQIPLATAHGGVNFVPAFVQNRPNGPVVEARFPRATDSTGTPINVLDGSVQQLYTLRGRTDAPVPCTITQPNFPAAVNNNNVIFRIPTPTFGMGFIETVPDDTLRANLLAVSSNTVGVGGHLNTNGNDQTVTRFGWKAQNASMLMFAGEASNVEMGITNELFPFERRPGDCVGNPTPEDFTTPNNQTLSTNPVVVASDIELQSFFMFANTAPAQCDFSSQAPNGVPQCLPLSAAALDGQTQFRNAGCNTCHTPTLTTGPSQFTDLNNATFAPFSDFALHHMGSKLADGVSQGAAGPDEFRTAPLWGTGQRLFFLHDGRTNNLVDVIEQFHTSLATDCVKVSTVAESFILNGQAISIPAQTSTFCGSEANAVVQKFNQLSCTQQQDVILFLRSL